MGKPHPMELRTRVVAYVDEGHGHRTTARHFRFSPKFVNDLVKLRRETGSMAPRRQGNGGGRGKLAGVTNWVEARVAARGRLGLMSWLRNSPRPGIDAHRSTVWQALRGLGLTQKNLQALEQKRKDVADLRHIWIAKRQPFMARHVERLAFIDETSVKTNMSKTTVWAPCGQRLVDHAPFGHWRTQTFVAALRHDHLDPLGSSTGR